VNFSDRLTRRPKHKGNAMLSYQDGPFNLSLISHISGRRLDVDAVTFAIIDKPGYARFDLASSYALPWRPPGFRQISLFGKIENLSNKRYQEVDGFRARPLNVLVGLRGVFGTP
jgi:outer membrane cobalamin receptor